MLKAYLLILYNKCISETEIKKRQKNGIVVDFVILYYAKTIF